MPTISCIECNNMIEINGDSCPECGFPMSLLVPQLCPECENMVSFNLGSCPECGYPCELLVVEDQPPEIAQVNLTKANVKNIINSSLIASDRLPIISNENVRTNDDLLMDIKLLIDSQLSTQKAISVIQDELSKLNQSNAGMNIKLENSQGDIVKSIQDIRSNISAVSLSINSSLSELREKQLIITSDINKLIQEKRPSSNNDNFASLFLGIMSIVIVVINVFITAYIVRLINK